MVVTELELDLAQHKASSQAEGLVSFLCPLCERRLNVPSHLAGIAGPCPACQKIIRAPQIHWGAQVIQPVLMPAGEDAMAGLADSEPLQESRRPSIQFNATKRILPPPADALDDSWREKAERRRERTRKRRRRTRFLNGCLAKTAVPRKIGICLLLGILAMTIGFLYLNHQSGGKLMSGGFGY